MNKKGLMERKLVLILLGLITAMALFVALIGGVYLSTPHSSLNTTGDIVIISYFVIPIVLLLLGIYQFIKTKNKRFLIYTISVLISAVILMPIFWLGLLFVIVVLFGVMPTPT